MKKVIGLIPVFLFCFAVYSDAKPVISVLDFQTEEGITKSEMRIFISLLTSALFKTNVFIVIDVSERETLLKELEFSVSGCSNESCQLEIGRLLSAEAIIIGRIGRFGTRYVLTAKMLQTGPSAGFYRVLRGGSWGNSMENCRIPIRNSIGPDSSFDHFGFRVVRTFQ